MGFRGGPSRGPSRVPGDKWTPEAGPQFSTEEEEEQEEREEAWLPRVLPPVAMFPSSWEAGAGSGHGASRTPGPALSHGTEEDGRRPRRLGTSRSVSGAWVSVSSRSESPSSAWTARSGGGGARGTAGSEGAAGGGGGSAPGWPLRGSPSGDRAPFSSFRLQSGGPGAQLELARFRGDGGRCRPWRALSSWPRSQAPWSPEPPQSAARLSSLGALGLFCGRRQADRQTDSPVRSGLDRMTASSR